MADSIKTGAEQAAAIARSVARAAEKYPEAMVAGGRVFRVGKLPEADDVFVDDGAIEPCVWVGDEPRYRQVVVIERGYASQNTVLQALRSDPRGRRLLLALARGVNATKALDDVGAEGRNET